MSTTPAPSAASPAVSSFASPAAIPPPSELARHWNLDPDVVFLNHGSFGACPRSVLEHQSELRARMEREPIRWFVESVEPLLDESRAELASFVGCRDEDLVFITNATQAVATVLANLEPDLKPGDELLAPGHEYPACMNNLRRTAARTGAKIVTAPLPFPLASADEAAAAVMSAVTARTRILLISHVTSPSALILPLERIVPELESRGIACIVDGAHAPGFTPAVDVSGLGCSFYTANCHKWICSPKGSAFLFVRSDRQGGFRPLILSNHAERPKPARKHLLTEFDFVGTSDPTAFMCVGPAIRVMRSFVPGGWPEIMRRNHDLAIRGRDVICRAISVEPPAPDVMLGSMSTIFLPAHDPDRHARIMARPSRYHDALQDALVEKHRIQVPVWSVPGDGRRLIRISAQLYNTPGQYEYLASALADELERERHL